MERLELIEGGLTRIGKNRIKVFARMAFRKKAAFRFCGKAAFLNRRQASRQAAAFGKR